MTQYRLLLRQLRQANELSQEELAQELGISRQSIISLERGEYLPSAPILISLMEFFDCSIEELMEGVRIRAEKAIQEQVDQESAEATQLLPKSPFQAIDALHSEVSDMVERTIGQVDWPRTVGSAVGAMNIHETSQSYELAIQVPGFTEQEITIEMTEDTLTISGQKENEDTSADETRNLIRREWDTNDFSRSVRFATPIKDSQVEARLENGALHIIAPKIEPTKPKTTKIPVTKK